MKAVGAARLPDSAADPAAPRPDGNPMNRHILIPVTAPALVIGLLLCGTCLVSAWYIHRLQRDMTALLSENVTSLQAAQELEIRVRQLRFHCFVYLTDNQPKRLARVEEAHRNFEEALRAARQPHETPEEEACLQAIEAGYRQYRDELARLRDEADRGRRPEDLGRLADTHPVTNIVEPCQRLLRLNQDALRHATQEAERVGGQANLVMLLVGIVGPLSGLVTGLGMAHALSRSICRLSVRVQDIAQRLDQDVASVNLVAEGDLQGLDQQLGHVLGRVEEVTERMQRQQRDMLRADPEADVRAKFHELAGVLLTPEGTKQVEAAVDRCEAWESVDELVAVVGTHLR